MNATLLRIATRRSESMSRIQKVVSTRPDARKPIKSWSFIPESQNSLGAIVGAHRSASRWNIPALKCGKLSTECHLVGGDVLSCRPRLSRDGRVCDCSLARYEVVVEVCLHHLLLCDAPRRCSCGHLRENSAAVSCALCLPSPFTPALLC